MTTITAVPTRTTANGLLTLQRVLLGCAALILTFYTVVYVVYGVNLMQFPFDYDQGEGFELVDTIMFSQGQFPYQDVEQYPFYASNYPPVFHLIAVPFVWLFGPAYWYGRLLGFLATAFTACILAYAVYSSGKRLTGRGHVTIAALSGLAFLASNFIYHIGPLMRQHMTMVMFEALAIIALAHVDTIDSTRRRRLTIVFGLAMLILAGYTKQLALFTAVAVFLWLFIRHPLRAVTWGLVFAGVGVGIFAWLTWVTDGQWWVQAILANANEIKFPQIEGLFRLWFSLHGFLLVPAALYAVYELYFDRLSLYSVWFVVTALLGGISSGTWGGGDSYFATSIAAMCVLSGLFATRTLNRAWRFADSAYTRRLIAPLRRYAPQFAVVGMVVIPLLYIGYGRAVLHLPTDVPVFAQIAQALNVEDNTERGFYDSAGRVAGGYADIGHLTTAEDIQAGYTIVEMILSDPRPTLSEEAGFSLAAGRDVITNPTQLLNLWLRGRYGGSELIAMIEEQAFGLIVLRAQFYPRPVNEAINAHYETTEIVTMNGFEYIIKRPRE